MNSQDRKKPTAAVGKVLSNKMDKTVVVGVSRIVSHSLYGKFVRRISRIKAHDEKNSSQIGDIVKIVHTRPLSKDKHWRVEKIVERGEQSSVSGV